MEWLPIESAPRDGTEVLFWRGEVRLGYVKMVPYSTPAGERGLDASVYPGGADLTGFSHWMPLPAAPNA